MQLYLDKAMWKEPREKELILLWARATMTSVMSKTSLTLNQPWNAKQYSIETNTQFNYPVKLKANITKKKIYIYIYQYSWTLKKKGLGIIMNPKKTWIT